MTIITYELYEAFKELGLNDEKAKATAEAVVGRAEAKEFATKSDISDIKAELGKFEVSQKFHSALLVGMLILIIGQYFVK